MGQQLTMKGDDLTPMHHHEAQHFEGRPAGGDSGEKVIRFGRFCVMLRTRRVLANGCPVEIGSRAFDLLVALLHARGALLTKNEIMDRVWPTTVVDESNLRVQMRLLRRALGEDRDFIKNIPGRGYVLTVESASGSDEPLPSLPRCRYGYVAMEMNAGSANPVHEQLLEAQARLATTVELTASAAYEVTERLTAIVANAQICLQRLAGDRADLDEMPRAATRENADRVANI